MGRGSAWDMSIDQINQIVWACGVGDSSKPWIAKSKDKGDSWETTLLSLDRADSLCYHIAIHPANPEIIYVATNEAVIKTKDGGGTWHYTDLQGKMTHLFALAIDPFNPEHIWVGGTVNENYLALFSSFFVLFESYNGGKSWQEVPQPEQLKQFGISSIATDPNQQGVLYIATTGDGVWRYKNIQPSLSRYFPLQIGNRWTFAETITESVIDTVSINNTLYYKLDSFKHLPDVSFRWTNDNQFLMRHDQAEQVWLAFSAEIGETWLVREPLLGLEWTVHLQSKTDTVSVPAGSFENCYRFWFQFAGADNDWVEWYAPAVGPVKRILYGFAVIESPLTSAYVNGSYYPTKVTEPPLQQIPEKFYLYPNYPNPFNSSTVISYDLPALNFVLLEIYNLLGQKVKTLVNSVQYPGQYQILWDGRDDRGNSLSTGIYLCHLQAGKRIFVLKIALIK